VRRSQRKTLALLVFSVALVLRTVSAFAHAVGLSSAEYAARDGSLAMKATFARSEIASLVPSLDANGDGHVTAMEVKSAGSDLERQVLERIVVTGDGAVCPAVLIDAALTDTDGFSLRARYDCPARVATFSVNVALLDDLPPGHRHLARVIGRTSEDVILVKGRSSFTVAACAAGEGAPSSASTSDLVPPRPQGAIAFFVMGIEHILTGYDHLLFLFGLVLVTSRLRDLLLVVTAFTVGHSLTLALAVTSVFAPSTRFIEPMIALSIAYVGIDNLFAPNPAKRWQITLPFGLLHGFGFASALRSVTLHRAEIPVALAAFNIGVEVGQVAVMVVLAAILVVARQRQWLGARRVRILSILIAITGVVWFTVRLIA